MDQEHWQPARLIPTSGINGQDEAERRATSALLAVLGSVKEFGAAIVRPLGAPAGAISTYIEVPFKLGDQSCAPDGLIRTARAGKTWTVLVEVKTGTAPLRKEQVETYLDVAREQEFAGVLTISNDIAPAPGVHPVAVDKRKLRKVSLWHLSWAEVLTIAVRERVHHGVEDPDQAWILAELIRYLEHPKSGALDFADMGAEWVTVRDAVAAGTLRSSDKGVDEVVSRWSQLLRFAALRLGRELGAEVQVAMSRKEAADPTLRHAAQVESLVKHHSLTGELRVPNAVGAIAVIADLRAGRVTVSVDADAPQEGRALTRVNWLVRQLSDAPDGLRIDAYSTGVRSSTSELLKRVREEPACLLQDPKRDVRMFRIAATSALGTKRSAGRGGFIDSVLVAIDGFYENVVQQLRPWTAKAPQLPKGAKLAAEDAGIDVTPPPSDVADLPPTEMHAVEAEPLEVVGDDEVVTWDDAHDRLDRERLHGDAVGETAVEAHDGSLSNN